jgi:pyrroloquinoline-quinone synthase
MLEAAAETRPFLESILRVMDRKHHRFWDHLNSPRATRSQWLLHFRQEWATYVRDFPVFLRRVHERCPAADVRADLMENILEEESGAVSGAGSHAELFLYMMDGFGHPRRLFEDVELLPESAAYRRFVDEAVAGPWLVGAAVSTIFVEGSVQDRSELEAGGSHGPAGDEADPFARHPLVIHQGLDPRYLELKRVHRRVEGGHRLDAYAAVAKHARSNAERSAVTGAIEKALDLWVSYRDAIERAARA